MKKSFIMALALVLVLGIAIGGTVAWLTAETDPVTNTFTVGDINISLAETTGQSYKIVPGGTQSKDPTVTVAKGSEKCYVYVKVTNNLVLTKDGQSTVVVTPNISTTDWISVGTSTDGKTTLYRYKDVVDATTVAKELAVFTKVSYSSDITKGNIESLKDKTIVVQAYAHQSENTTQDTADAAAKTWAGIAAATN